MGGDGVITHALSDRLAENLMDERLEQLKAHLGEEELYLSAEWASMLFRLRDTEKETGQQILTPDVFVHAAMESNRMKSLDWLNPKDIPELSDTTIIELTPEARNMYMGHSGIHSMLYRQDRLEAAAAIFLRAVDIDSGAEVYMSRMAANMCEELAWYDMFRGEVGAHYSIATELNQRVVEATDAYITPYKIHARLSLRDLAAIKLLAEHNTEPNPQLRSQLKDVHIGLNEDLIELASQLNKYIDDSKATASTIEDKEEHRTFHNRWTGHASVAAGTLTEGMTLSVLQNYVLSRGLSDRYWAIQAFMRQDAMGRRKLLLHRDKKEKLEALNITFDLQAFSFNQPDFQPVPIEVKKWQKAGRNLHPDIEVARLKMVDELSDYVGKIEKFAKAEVNKTKRGSFVRSEYDETHADIYERVEPQRILRKLIVT